MSELAILKKSDHQWEDLIKAQASSGQTIKAFCEARQIKQHVFYYWKQKLFGIAEKHKRFANASGRFIKLAKQINEATQTPRIHLPNGVQIDLGLGLDSGLVDQFLKSLCGVAHAQS